MASSEASGHETTLPTGDASSDATSVAASDEANDDRSEVSIRH